jgi:hypothetical protein
MHPIGASPLETEVKIAVATPSRGLVHSRTVAAVMANLEGHEFTGWFLSHDLPIPECAERTMGDALASGADAVWSVEEDTIPPAGALDASLALLAQGYAVAAVDYPVQPDIGCLGRDEAGNILWVGLGSTLISRQAFEAVARPWFRVARGYGGHDIYFCKQVLAAGLQIGQVPDLIAGHARLEEPGKLGTNMGAHRIKVLERITRQYSEPGPPPAITLGDGVVVLVPRRADGGRRDRLWAYCRDWWARSVDVPIFEGHHDEGPFNRSAAINRAAKAAGDWQMAVIVDSDTIPEVGQLQGAVNHARLTNQMVVPFNDRRELTAGETERVLHGEPLAANMGSPYPPAVSGVAVVSRRLWDVVGGFDEGFVGWGYEDTHFGEACERTGGRIVQIPGPLWHLHHDKSPDATLKSSIAQANKRHWEASHVSPAELYRSRTLPVGEMTAERIPAILHRVLIGLEPDDSKRWWAQFAAMHPTWELRTHTLPFDPEQWPLTSWVFGHCVHPAQLADFIRLEALWNDGGVYVDYDIEPVHPLDSLLPLDGFVGWALDWLAANGVMGFRPHHPAIARALELAMERFVADPKDMVAIGPGAITEACRDRSDVLMLPPQAFYPAGHVANPRQKEGQFAGEPWVFVAHWGHATWQALDPWKAKPTTLDAVRARRERRLNRPQRTKPVTWMTAE